MPILFGKSKNVLSEFCITNQTIENLQFKTKNRSINKSLQSYQWKEKASIKYDFDFIEESTFQDLTYLLTNKSSLNEGFLTMPIPYSNNKSKCIYDFNGITSPSSFHVCKTYSGPKGVDDFNPITETHDIELTTAQYTSIGSYDTNKVEVTNVGNGTWLTFEFNINDFLTTFSYKEIKRFMFVFFGMKSSPIKFYLWDYDNAEWYNIEDYYYYDSSKFAESSFYLNYQMIAPFSLPFGYESINTNFIDSNKIIFGVYSTSSTQNLLCQYIKMFINGYNVIADDPEAMNYRDYFIGAGRRGQLSLLEI